MTEGLAKEREMVKAYLKPIPPDPDLEKMDKNTLTYRYKQRKGACILCFNTATRMLIYELEGCTKIERYCGVCISKVTNQSSSGI